MLEDLFKHSAKSEKKLKRLLELQKAKQKLLEHDVLNPVYLNFAQPVSIKDEYMV